MLNKMNKATWRIGTISWGGGSLQTHLTIELEDPELLPAVEEFAQTEKLRVLPSLLDRPNEYWIDYPRDDFDDAQARLEGYILVLYWKNRWITESQYKVGDRVEIIAVLMASPSQHPVFVEMNDTGSIVEVVGFDLYKVAFKSSGTISGVPGRNLQPAE